MKKTSLLAAAAVLALTSSFALAGPGASTAGHATKARVLPSQSPDAVLYDQTSNDSGIGIVSQNFEASFDAYDAQGADDFAVPTGSCWRIKEVDATGVYFNGSGPASSVRVTFYKQQSGAPNEAAIIADFPSIVPTDVGGSFVIPLPSAVKAKGGKKYWVSVVANLDFGLGGEWAWETTNTLNGKGAMWKNPGGGFGTGCTAYADMVSCIGALGQGPDYMFTLKGKSSAC
jgi:hypothetical protein